MAFCFRLQPVVERSLEVELGFNTWYLDDGTLIGPIEELVRAFSIIMDTAPSIGLRVNVAKCELWGPACEELHLAKLGLPPNHSFLNIRRVSFLPGSGITVLGNPVPHPEDADKFLRAFWEPKNRSWLDPARS